jgi:hypothetical protein
LNRGRGHPAAGGRGSLTAGPHLSVPRRKKKKRRRGLGRQGNELGQRGPLARARGEAEEKREGEKNWAGWKRRERGEGVKAFSFFKKNLFKFVFFQTFKLQSNRNPCIRIMMHKHLLFLNYFSDIQIFKSQFI